jgi:oxygen-independent coproporphyrinogen III oxidase
MRMFRAPHAPADDGPAYCCQSDGMVGLGAGARSYTTALHYSSRYAVDRAGTREIIESYVDSAPASFALAQYGFELPVDEQRRRFVIQSLLTFPGLDHARYESRFGSRSFDDLPQLKELLAMGLGHDDGRLLALNDNGMAMADVIGPWLSSESVHRLSRETRC